MNFIELEKAKDRIIEAARFMRGVEYNSQVSIRIDLIKNLQQAVFDFDNLHKKPDPEIDDLAKIFGIDLSNPDQEIPDKEYPLPNYKDDATKFILSKEFKEKSGLIRKILGEFFPLPDISTLIVGKNRIGKTPVLKYWKEYLENRILDIEREERIQSEETNSYIRLDDERKKFSSLYKTELELYEKFENHELIDYSNRTGYLFLDDILQESIWGDSRNFKHNQFIATMTKFYEKLRDNYNGNLIVVATSNHLPTSESVDGNTRIQSRVLGTFKKIINIEEK